MGFPCIAGPLAGATRWPMMTDTIPSPLKLLTYSSVIFVLAFGGMVLSYRLIMG
jgi:hypothetical protein